MTGLKRLFCDHPQSVDETYSEHLAFASGFGFKMILGGLACIMHGIFPFLFTRTGSRYVCELHERLSQGGRPTSTAEIKAEQAVSS